MKDENLCNAVGCKAISDHTTKCIVELESGEHQVHTIKFCHDHYLRQKAFEYGMRKVKNGDVVDWEEINPRGWKKSLIYNTFYSLEMAKKTIWDSW